MSSFPTIALGCLLGKKGYIRGPFGSSLRRGEMQKSGVSVYEQKNAIYDERKFRFFISDKKFKELERFQVKTNDLIISCSGTVGRISVIKENDPKGIISQALLILRPDASKVSVEFLYYFLTSKRGYNLITSASHGSVQTNIAPRQVVESIPVPFPPLSDQQAIGSILSVLDEKIDNNKRMNQTLEEMAHAIFKSWFLNFDPVHAKVSGKTPIGMSAEIADLFPSSFDNDGLPSGWIESEFKDFNIEIDSGKRPKGGIDKSLSEGVPSIGAESLLKIGVFEYSKLKYVEKEFADKVSKGWIKNYDVAIYKDGANVGDPERVSLFGNGFPFDEFMVNEHVFLLRSKTIGQPFLYNLLKTAKLSQQLHSMGNSKAAQPGLNQQEVLSCKFIAPDKELFDVFNETVFPLIDKRLAIGKENQILSELRDILLPKLVSGQVRVEH